MRGAWGALNAALILLAVGALLAGCGRKGPPVVPRVPAAVKPQPSYRAEGDTLVLAWRYPAGALQPESFRILRAEPETGCPECPPRYHEVGNLGAQAGGGYLFRDEGLTPGAAYAYQVLPLFPRGVEGPLSDTVRLTWRATPPPNKMRSGSNRLAAMLRPRPRASAPAATTALASSPCRQSFSIQVAISGRPGD